MNDTVRHVGDYEAVKLKRRGRGCELNASYWRDSIVYARAAEQEISTPSLFDLLDTQEAA